MPPFVWIMIVVIGFIVFCMVIKFRGDADESRRNATEIDSESPNLNTKIDATYRLYFGDSDLPRADKLVKIHKAAMQILDQAKQTFKSSNAIMRTSDTSSDLSLCGVSKTHFYTNIDKFSFCRIYSYSELDKKYHYAVDYHNKSDFSAIQTAVDDFEKLKNQGTSPSGVKAIPLDDILFFKTEGSVAHLSNVQGGGVNLQGAVAGAIIGGGAAAVIGSQIGTETKTEIITKDDRKVILYTQAGECVKTQDIRSENVDNTIAALRSLIPSKEESVVQVNKQNNLGIITGEKNEKEPKNGFKFQVDDYFTFKGKGLYVRGIIIEGTICVNDNVELRHIDGTSMPATVNTIVLCEAAVQTATLGDDAALILSEITKYDMRPGDIIVK